MLVRAYDETDARMQEEVLKKTVSLAKQLDIQLVKQAIIPRVHGLALKTTVAAVRVNALLCLGDMVHILDKQGVLDILQTIQRCTSVDRSAPTLMCTLGVANSILKQYGIEFVAEHVLPLLTPLLVAQQLNVQQFAKYMFFVKDVLRKIEEKRGVTLTDSGVPEARPSPAADGPLPGLVNKSVAMSSNTKRSPSWDEDWIPARGASTAPQSTTMSSNAQPAIPSQPDQAPAGYSQSSLTSSAASQQLPSSCPAVDIEWPPRSSSGVSTQLGDSGKLNENKDLSAASFDDIDPFANWPPRPSGNMTLSGSSTNGLAAPFANKYTPSNNATSTGGTSSQPISWDFGSQNSFEPMRQNHGNSVSSSVSSLGVGRHSAQNSIGYFKQSQNTSTQKAADLGSIFASNKSEQTAPRIAPPPATAVGRGRGRGRGNQGQLRTASASRPSHGKSQPEQPPLLDLL